MNHTVPDTDTDRRSFLISLPDSYTSLPRHPFLAVPVDTYRPCRSCGGERDEDFQIVAVWRVVAPAVPRWLTTEIHYCASGHGTLTAFRTPAAVRTLPKRTDPEVLDARARAFELIGLDGRRAVV
ncbi:hypothetical protein [Nocardia sp. alder85J]|uniref:hypothetical protein n=1 Tax=Nocardia sp. alder85J TaxID=2862949 RepID=UPI001CD2B2E0|nr:hypothetical protein [Nocardia sp. alder85J]MCX4096285.1 hypothetical protein [Nocardia sp. alder85J]